MGFATLISLEINTGSQPVDPISSPITPSTSCSSLPLDDDHILKLQFALLSYQATFIDQFGIALDTARARRASGVNDLSCPPLVSMDGVFKEEIELGRKEEEEEAEQHQAQEEPADGEGISLKLRIIFGLTEGEALWSEFSFEIEAERSRCERTKDDDARLINLAFLYLFSLSLTSRHPLWNSAIHHSPSRSSHRLTEVHRVLQEDDRWTRVSIPFDSSFCSTSFFLVSKSAAKLLILFFIFAASSTDSLSKRSRELRR